MNNIYYNCLLKKLKSSQREILEGVGFIELFNGTPEEKKLVLSYPALVLGTSALKSSARTYKRSKELRKTDKKAASPIVSFLYSGFINVLGMSDEINQYKKARRKIPNTKMKILKI
jgi:hypothetical protein